MKSSVDVGTSGCFTLTESEIPRLLYHLFGNPYSLKLSSTFRNRCSQELEDVAEASDGEDGTDVVVDVPDIDVYALVLGILQDAQEDAQTR